MTKSIFHGLIAATYTPLDEDGNLNLGQIGPLVEHLEQSGVQGVYVCGSTGEGMSLTSDERRAVTEATISAALGKLPVMVQVGHNSVAEGRALAAHAQQVGVDALSATCPSYYGIATVNQLIDTMAEIAAGAPQLPFYYYHIPVLTGVDLDMITFLERAPKKIPTLVGIKYTDTKLHDFQQCLEFEEGRFDLFWGCDEMLLGALATGARSAVGSTFNIAAPLYQAIIDAFDQGDHEMARRLQLLAVKMIKTIANYPFHPAMKEILKMLGHDFGPCRLPMVKLSPADVNNLRTDLEQINFFQFSKTPPTAELLEK